MPEPHISVHSKVRAILILLLVYYKFNNNIVTINKKLELLLKHNGYLTNYFTIEFFGQHLH